MQHPPHAHHHMPHLDPAQLGVTLALTAPLALVGDIVLRVITSVLIAVVTSVLMAYLKTVTDRLQPPPRSGSVPPREDRTSREDAHRDSNSG